MILIIFFFLTLTSIAYSQDKQDYIWLLGDDQEIGIGVRALHFDFNKIPFDPEIRDKGLNFDRNNVSICNQQGELLFYSNGCAIANRDHETMINGDSINSGEFFEDFWFGGSCSFGYPGRQDMLILQDPGFAEGYYVLHKRLDRHIDGDFHPLSISFSYIDMTLDNGRFSYNR